MSSLTVVWNFFWSRRKYWKGPIIVMVVVVGILFAAAMTARVLPLISPMM
jgi:hypothetical protein